ncbi:hypothetical protein N7481_002154 [Penicillium waksmanii]|uniref:uncharacterized protein n=1 Tax=Penicillium waksmanii TaxID=69791 RepID=UPI0025481E85|nr:uncharacterized protein N7481_002154 [Penicillium waksmanii]KAJ5995177.1 hypothetical protein N7481_002154 [Penicillium waksmanii]
MELEHEYSFFKVSKTENVSEAAQKYRDLRLRALKTSPSSFSSTYETEAAFSESDWIDRLTVPDREVFICAATPVVRNTTAPPVEWIGQVTLRGPMSMADFALPTESGQTELKSDAEEERWQMLSLFTLPEHRGNGLGGKLCQVAVDCLRTWQSSPNQIHIRLMVKPENHVTVNLYKRLGFATIGKCTLAEALRANGDGHLLPKELASAKYSQRSGLIMSIFVHRN